MKWTIRVKFPKRFLNAVLSCKNNVKKISHLDYVHVHYFFYNVVVDRYSCKIADFHEKKFVGWWGSIKSTTMKLNSCTFNLSGYQLSKKGEFPLSLGLNFAYLTLNKTSGSALCVLVI